jgi:hypothetical protein
MWDAYKIPKSLLLLIFAVHGIASKGSAQTVVTGEPLGFVRMEIGAGTGTSKKTTLISIPLLDEAQVSGRSSGRISAVSSTTITSEGAGWTPGALSNPAEPYLLEITSGNAQGLMLLLSTTSANTSDTATIDTDEIARTGALTSLGITTADTYRIRPVDTLGSFFGTPDATLIHGGASPQTADTVTLVNNGSAATYYFNTAVTPARWSRVALGSPDATNTPIPPYAGIQYARLADTPLEFIVTGRVPSGRRQLALKNSGVTIISTYWPTGQTLAGLNINHTPNWRYGSSPAVADTLTLTSNGSATSYFHNGTNWRRVGLGAPLADGTLIPASTGIIVNRKENITGFSPYTHYAPYTLE